MQRILLASVAAFIVTCIVGSLLFIGHAQALPAPTNCGSRRISGRLQRHV